MTDTRLALFDCDGTLVDSQHLIVRAATQACADLALTVPTPSAIRHLVGLSLGDALARLAPELGPAGQETLADRYRHHFSALVAAGAVTAPLFPGALGALARLEAADIRLGIVTGKSRRGLDETLQCHGLGDRFATLQTADRANGKPAPDMVLRAAEETGVEARSIVVIGDTVFDIAMARAAGTPAIGVAWGYHDTEDLDAAGAVAIVHSFDEVPDAVQRALA